MSSLDKSLAAADAELAAGAARPASEVFAELGLEPEEPLTEDQLARLPGGDGRTISDVFDEMEARGEFVKVLTPHYAPSDDEIAAWQPFGRAAAKAAWDLKVEWLDPYVDPLADVSYPGGFHWFISHEALASDGRFHVYMLDLPSSPPYEEAWASTLELAGEGWRKHLEDAGVTV